ELPKVIPQRQIDPGVAIDLVMGPRGLEEAAEIDLETKEVKASKKGPCYKCGIEGHFASECRKPKENKAFVGELRVIVKMVMNLKMTLLVLWQLNLKRYKLNPLLLVVIQILLICKRKKEKLLKFNKDFTKTFEKLLKEKCSLENENSKLLSRINDLEIEVKKLANDKEVVEP
ncbi:retrotransposon protein, partial [Tanacetum coccineum]